MIKVRCQCGQAFQAKDEWAGKKTKCPKCSQPLKIPAGSNPQPVAIGGDSVAAEPVPAATAAPATTPAVEIAAATHPAAIAELEAAHERYEKPGERLAVFCGGTFLLSIVAAGAIWYFYSWLLALGVVFGVFVLLGALSAIMGSQWGRRAAAEVQLIENRFSLTHEQTLEIFRGSRDPDQLSKAKDFITAVWGEAAASPAPSSGGEGLKGGAAQTAGQVDISAVDRKLRVFELWCNLQLEPDLERFRSLWKKFESKSGQALDRAFVAQVEGVVDQLLPGFPEAKTCIGCNAPPGAKKLYQAYELELIVRIQVNTGSPFDQTPERTQKRLRSVNWPVCDVCAERFERTLQALKQLPDTLQPVGFGLTGMFSGGKRNELLQKVQQALAERDFQLDRDLWLPPIVKEFKREIYFEASTPLVRLMTPGMRIPELIVNAQQRLVMHFASKSSRSAVRSVAGDWDSREINDWETALWPLCWEVRNPLAKYRIQS